VTHPLFAVSDSALPQPWESHRRMALIAETE